MKMQCVYHLKCADDSFYIGLTNNIGSRLTSQFTG